MDEYDNEFWKQNERTMYGAVKGLYATGWSLDDLLNEARLGIWEAHKSWDPDRGMSWRTYSFLCARRKVMTLVTLSRRKKNLFILDMANLENSEAQEVPEPSLVSEYRLRFLYLIQQIELTDLERSVIDLWIKDWSYKEIASELNINRKRVDNAMQRIVKKLKFVTIK